MSDKLADGRSFRILTLVDQFTRECVGLEADRSMTGMKKALRNSIANSRLKPSGTNFTSTPGNHGATYFLAHLGETLTFHSRVFATGNGRP